MRWLCPAFLTEGARWRWRWLRGKPTTATFVPTCFAVERGPAGSVLWPLWNSCGSRRSSCRGRIWNISWCSYCFWCFLPGVAEFCCALNAIIVLDASFSTFVTCSKTHLQLQGGCGANLSVAQVWDEALEKVNYSDASCMTQDVALRRVDKNWYTLEVFHREWTMHACKWFLHFYRFLQLNCPCERGNFANGII